MEKSKLTLTDIFKRREEQIKAQIAEQDAWEATPEGKAWRAQQDAHHKRMREADERAAAEQPSPYDVGREAAECDQPREAPDSYTDNEAEQWFDGYDSFGSEED